MRLGLGLTALTADCVVRPTDKFQHQPSSSTLLSCQHFTSSPLLLVATDSLLLNYHWNNNVSSCNPGSVIWSHVTQLLSPMFKRLLSEAELHSAVEMFRVSRVAANVNNNCSSPSPAYLDLREMFPWTHNKTLRIISASSRILLIVTAAQISSRNSTKRELIKWALFWVTVSLEQEYLCSENSGKGCQ